MNSSELILMLQQESPLFSRVKSSTLAAHLGNTGRIRLAPGQILLVPGQQNGRIYIVLSGRLRAQLNLDENMTPIALFGLGECVGEMSMFEDNLVSAYVIAVTDCELLSIAHSDVWAILDESLAASHNMLNILAVRMHASNRLLAKTLETAPGYEALDYINPVTGIYNRHWLAENITRLIHRHTINEQPCAFILVRADNISHYAARFGALGSDQAQRTIAQTLLRCTRPNDTSVHLSDDRFATFLPQSTPEKVDAIIARLGEELRAACISTPTGDALPPLTLSFGATPVKAQDTLDDLIARALRSMHGKQATTTH